MIDYNKVKQKSLTRLMVCYSDRETPKYFYSYDSKQDILKDDRRQGMNGLIKRILEKHKGLWHTAIIYSNKPPFEELMTFKNGEKIK